MAGRACWCWRRDALLLAVALIFLLPESVRYLVVKQHPAQRIAAILRHIAPLPKAVEFVLREAGG